MEKDLPSLNVDNPHPHTGGWIEYRCKRVSLPLAQVFIHSIHIHIHIHILCIYLSRYLPPPHQTNQFGPSCLLHMMK